MNEKTILAKKVLEEENLTLVLVGENETIRSTAKGVSGLLKLYDEKKDLSAFCAADKIVGKGAAVLFFLLGIREIYAEVLGEKAKEFLEENGVSVFSGTVTECIVNRKGDGLCPIEKAVGNENDPEKAVLLIKKRISEMLKSNG